MKENFLQIVKKKKLLMKLAMITLVGSAGVFGMSCMTNSYAMKPKTSAGSKKKSHKKCHPKSERKKSSGVAKSAAEAKKSLCASTQERKTEDTSETQQSVVGDEFSRFESELLCDEEVQKPTGKTYDDKLKIDFGDKTSLPKVKVLCSSGEFNDVVPRHDEIDYYVKFEDKNIKTSVDRFNTLLREIAGCVNEEALKTLEGDVHDLTSFKDFLIAFEDLRGMESQEGFGLSFKINILRDVFYRSILLVGRADLRQEVFLTCQKVRAFVKQHPDLISLESVEEAIDNVVKLRNLDGVDRDCLKSDKFKNIKTRWFYASGGFSEKFLDTLQKLDQAQLKMYDEVLQLKALSEKRDYEGVQSKIIDVIKARDEYSTLGEILKRMMSQGVSESFKQTYGDIETFSNEINKKILENIERVTALGSGWELRTAFDFYVNKDVQRIYRVNQLYLKNSTFVKIILDKLKENAKAKNPDERKIVVSSTIERIKRKYSSMISYIDWMFESLNDFYILGTTYLTEGTYKDVCDAIDFLETNRRRFEEENERIDSDKFLKSIEDELQRCEAVKEQERVKAEKHAAEVRERQKDEEKLNRDAETRATWVEEQHRKKNEEQERIKTALQHKSELRKQEILSQDPIYSVTYINDTQRALAEDFLCANEQYEEDWKDWFDYTCRGWFTPNPLRNVPKAPFFIDRNRLVHPFRGKIFEAEVRTDGKQQGLRVVFYKDKNSDRVVIIYVGKPFGEQHGNKMPPILIEEATFCPTEREYEKMSAIKTTDGTRKNS